MEEVLLSDSVEKTYAFASHFAEKLEPGDIVLLSGNLGAGKTTFMQGLAKGLGIEKRIISPTFVLVRSYTLQKNPKIHTLYHIDLYRIQREGDMLQVGINAFFSDKNAIVAVEWPEKLGNLLPKKRWEVHCVYVGEQSRQFRITKSN